MSNISIRTDLKPAAKDAVGLYLSVGWGKIENYSLDAWNVALENNNFLVTAYDGSVLVGLARVLSDNVNDTYITDVVVHPRYQKSGIGRNLVEQVLKSYSHTAVYVCGLSSAEDFIIKCGLKKKAQLSALSVAATLV